MVNTVGISVYFNFNLQSYLQPYKILTTRNYLKTLLVERSQRSVMMQGLNNWLQDILIYERYTALENLGLQQAVSQFLNSYLTYIRQ